MAHGRASTSGSARAYVKSMHVSELSGRRASCRGLGKQREYLCSPRSTIRLQVGKHALCASPQASAQLPRLTRDSGEEALVFGFWCTRKTHVARRDIGLCGDCITTVTTAACT